MSGADEAMMIKSEERAALTEVRARVCEFASQLEAEGVGLVAVVDALMLAGIHGAVKVSGPTAAAAWMQIWITFASGDARESARLVALGSSTPRRGGAKKFSDFMAVLPEHSPIGNSIIGSGVYVGAMSDKYSCQFACFFPSLYGN